MKSKKVDLFSKEHGNIESSRKYFLDMNIAKNYSIIDIGCRYGSLIHNLYKKGYKNVWGIDKNGNTISEGRNKYTEIEEKLVCYEGNNVPFKDNSFDVVLMFDVIEHIPNIENFLSTEVFRILKPGGIFVFQTPNKIINAPWAMISNKSFTKYKKWHCSLQSYFSLSKLLKKASFNDVTIEKYNIITEYNIKKVKNRFGLIGIFFLKLASFLPIYLYPNFWGNCKK